MHYIPESTADVGDAAKKARTPRRSALARDLMTGLVFFVTSWQAPWATWWAVVGNRHIISRA